MINPANVGKLADALLRCLNNPKTKRMRYSAWDTLEALVTVSASAVYHCADDKGPALAGLCDQFQMKVRERILCYGRDEAFHDNDKPALGEAEED